MADPSPKRPAQYYSMIVDTHKSDEMVIVVWLSVPFVGPAIQKMPGMQEALDKYVVVGVIRIRRDGDKILLDLGPDPVPSGPDGKALKQVPGPEVPEEIKKLVLITKFGWASAQASSQMGEIADLPALAPRFHFLAFESGTVNACSKGQLRVRYAGETYTFDTPIPGCPAP